MRPDYNACQETVAVLVADIFKQIGCSLDLAIMECFLIFTFAQNYILIYQCTLFLSVNTK